MNELEQQLEQLESKSAVLEPNQQTRDQWFNAVQQFVNTYIEKLPNEKAYVKTDEQPSYHFDPNHTKTIESIIQELQHNFNHYGLRASSGGHIGYIPGGGIFPAGLGDLLADITNEYAGMYFGSPGAVTLENTLLDWLKEVFDFPNDAIGNLTSGGSIANLIALTAARDRHNIKNEKIPNAVVYLSPQVHHCIQKALRIIGLGDVIIRKIKLDHNHKMQPEVLRHNIQKDQQNGLQPFLVIASAGTTDTGAIDPLERLGTIAHEYNCWYHIDGAYGGFFYLLDEIKPKMKGIEQADSLVIDPHKGLFLPYGLGAVLVKDQEAVFNSHHYTANYMQDAYDDGLPVNPADVSPELTKHFRGLRMWFPLQLFGIKPFKACLREKILLTHYFRNHLQAMGFAAGPAPDLSVSYFYWPHNDAGQQDQINRNIHKVLLEDGRVFFSSSVIDNQFVIRIAILSFRTKKTTIDTAIDMVQKATPKESNLATN